MKFNAAFAFFVAIAASGSNASPIVKRATDLATLSMTVCTEEDLGGTCEDFEIDFSGAETTCVNFSGPLATAVQSADITTIEGLVAFFPLADCSNSDGNIDFDFNEAGEEVFIPSFEAFTSAKLVSFLIESA